MTLMSDVKSPDPMLDAVRTAWRNTLSRDVDDFQSWADAGGDSLQAMKLLIGLETILDRPLMHDVLDIEMTPITLARRLEQILQSAE